MIEIIFSNVTYKQLAFINIETDFARNNVDIRVNKVRTIEQSSNNRRTMEPE